MARRRCAVTCTSISLVEGMEGLNNGDTAWMAMSCALVLFMTPGLAFFYGGLVRDSNIVNTMMMLLGMFADSQEATAAKRLRKICEQLREMLSDA